MGFTQPFCGLDPFVGVPGWHPDVCQDHVGALGVDGSEQGTEIAAHRRDLELGLRLEQAPDSLANEVVVLREHEPNRHGQRIRRYRSSL